MLSVSVIVVRLGAVANDDAGAAAAATIMAKASAKFLNGIRFSS